MCVREKRKSGAGSLKKPTRFVIGFMTGVTIGSVIIVVAKS